MSQKSTGTTCYFRNCNRKVPNLSFNYYMKTKVCVSFLDKRDINNSKAIASLTFQGFQYLCEAHHKETVQKDKNQGKEKNFRIIKAWTPEHDAFYKEYKSHLHSIGFVAPQSEPKNLQHWGFFGTNKWDKELNQGGIKTFSNFSRMFTFKDDNNNNMPLPGLNYSPTRSPAAFNSQGFRSLLNNTNNNAATVTTNNSTTISPTTTTNNSITISPTTNTNNSTTISPTATTTHNMSTKPKKQYSQECNKSGCIDRIIGFPLSNYKTSKLVWSSVNANLKDDYGRLWIQICSVQGWTWLCDIHAKEYDEMENQQSKLPDMNCFHIGTAEHKAFYNKYNDFCKEKCIASPNDKYKDIFGHSSFFTTRLHDGRINKGRSVDMNVAIFFVDKTTQTDQNRSYLAGFKSAHLPSQRTMPPRRSISSYLANKNKTPLYNRDIINDKNTKNKKKKTLLIGGINNKNTQNKKKTSLMNNNVMNNNNTQNTNKQSKKNQSVLLNQNNDFIIEPNLSTFNNNNIIIEPNLQTFNNNNTINQHDLSLFNNPNINDNNDNYLDLTGYDQPSSYTLASGTSHKVSDLRFNPLRGIKDNNLPNALLNNNQNELPILNLADSSSENDDDTKIDDNKMDIDNDNNNNNNNNVFDLSTLRYGNIKLEKEKYSDTNKNMVQYDAYDTRREWTHHEAFCLLDYLAKEDFGGFGTVTRFCKHKDRKIGVGCYMGVEAKCQRKLDAYNLLYSKIKSYKQIIESNSTNSVQLQIGAKKKKPIKQHALMRFKKENTNNNGLGEAIKTWNNNVTKLRSIVDAFSAKYASLRKNGWGHGLTGKSATEFAKSRQYQKNKNKKNQNHSFKPSSNITGDPDQIDKKIQKTKDAHDLKIDTVNILSRKADATENMTNGILAIARTQMSAEDKILYGELQFFVMMTNMDNQQTIYNTISKKPQEWLIFWRMIQKKTQQEKVEALNKKLIFESKLK